MANSKDNILAKKLINNWKRKVLTLLKKGIKKGGLRQKEIARMSNISEDQLSKIIKGKVENPRVSTLERIEKVLKKNGM